MAYYPDGSHYVYARTLPEPHILNIGWLSKDHPYEQGPSPAWFISRLREPNFSAGKSL
jgi:hypothetical protein